MKPIYIIGAGGAAKEIYLLIEEINALHRTYDFKGFVDVDNNESLQIGSRKLSIIKESTFINNQKENVSIVFGIGDTNRLKKIVQIYQNNPSFEFPNVIHPDVHLDESVKLGIGNIITTKCVFTVDIAIKSFNYINRGVHIGHDCIIGSYNVLNPCAVISGGVMIEDENLIGTNASILQYLKIGSKNKIGAGAVVTKDVSDETCMIGVPAKNKK
ncbi:NeuD/PglB/VioB family sugar acetyltransferase [uncultured Aquimarina sp.]|uniref:NeuD/PglB/VioB family sugar acetyltransferase n=1 Tax=uncultured Aquimarina sp. TaxID=575652 RepID=UPI00261C187C|nr:NeuD/PglB/VioB family sugar acetyltransferase [uncultured Aquimarina sp.]